MNKETLTVYTDKDGTVRYYNADGQLHHPNGPAIVGADGSKSYYINGELHNPHGAAVIYPDGSKWYYINDQLLTEAELKTWQTQQTAK